MEIVDFIRKQISDRLDCSGTAFFSSATTLRRGKYLIVGINPGGGKEETLTIGQSLVKFQTGEWENAYFDSSWEGSKYQKGVRRLFEHLRVDLREVCSTNFIFERSQNEKELSNDIHDGYRVILNKVIEVVEPENIIAIGRTPYNELKRMLNTKDENDIFFRSAHGNWQISLSVGEFKGNMTKILYLPHLSRYALYNKIQQLDWIKQQIG
jgi:hypothetical protein